MLRAFVLCLACLVLTTACGDAPTRAEREQRNVPHVYTTFYPTTYVVQRIAADRATVICPLPDGEDPAFWKPDADIIARYQDDADLIVVNGAKLEKWVGRTSLPRGRICDTLAGHDKQLIRYRSPVKHTHGGKEHVHKDIDGHTWIDPTMALVQAAGIHDSLASRFPQHAAANTVGYGLLVLDLKELDAEFRALGSLADGMWIYAAHRAYAYLARTYGWRFVNLDLDPDSVPSAEELAVIKKTLAVKEGRFLWWERAPSEAVANAIKEKTGLESIVFSPCTSAPESGDYLSVMRGNLERARPAFAK